MLCYKFIKKNIPKKKGLKLYVDLFRVMHQYTIVNVRTQTLVKPIRCGKLIFLLIVCTGYFLHPIKTVLQVLCGNNYTCQVCPWFSCKFCFVQTALIGCICVLNSTDASGQLTVHFKPVMKFVYLCMHMH